MSALDMRRFSYAFIIDQKVSDGLNPPYWIPYFWADGLKCCMDYAENLEPYPSNVVEILRPSDENLKVAERSITGVWVFLEGGR